MVNNIDDRSSRRRPIAREHVDLALDFSENDTTIEGDININGTIMDVYFIVPALNAGTQCTLSFEDEDNNELWSSGLVDQSLTHTLTPGISLVGTTTVKVVTASAQAADLDFVAQIRYA